MSEYIIQIEPMLARGQCKDSFHIVKELVRCKDCKWWNQPFCDKHFDAYIRNADWFCADGKVATVKDDGSKDSGDVKKEKYSWIVLDNGEYKCPKCGDTSAIAFKKCNTCGAEMM